MDIVEQLCDASSRLSAVFPPEDRAVRASHLVHQACLLHMRLR